MTCRGLLGLALLVGLASAAPVGQRVPAQQSDSLKPQPVPAESAAKVDTVRPYRPARSTGTAVLLSFLLPGGGQVYTGNWWKAALIAPTEVTLGYFVVKEHLSASDYLSRFSLHHVHSDSANYVRHRDARTAFLWWTGAVVAFSMADAYVSAQMFGFDREMRFTIGPSEVRTSNVERRTTDFGLGVRAGIAVGL